MDDEEMWLEHNLYPWLDDPSMEANEEPLWTVDEDGEFDDEEYNRDDEE